MLAIVGAVIGTIWGVSAKFYEDYKVNKTVEDLALIITGVQSLISARDGELIGFADLTPTTRNAGIFPTDWLGDTTVQNPFGGLVAVWGNTTTFFVQIFGIPRSSCIKLVVKITSADKIRGHYIQVNTGVNFGASSFHGKDSRLTQIKV